MVVTKKQWFIFLFLVFSFILMGGVVAFISASLLAFIPAYMYLKSIRNSEKVDREPWEPIQIAFVWGALSGVFLAMIFNALGVSLLIVIYTGLDGTSNVDVSLILAGVIVAPIVEEFVKPLVMFQNQTIRKEIDELEDGIVYGAACGLGFGATENVLYGLTSGMEMAGLAGVVLLIVARTVSSILMHSVTTSITGHGISRYMVSGEPFSVVLKSYMVAVILHATWNLAFIYSELFGSETGSFLIFLFSVLLAVAGLQLSRKRIATIEGTKSILPVSESLPPSNSWEESKWDGSENKWDTRSTLWDLKKEEVQASRNPSQASTLYSPETATAVGSDIDWKSTIGTIIFLVFIAFNILEALGTF